MNLQTHVLYLYTEEMVDFILTKSTIGSKLNRKSQLKIKLSSIHL